MKVLVVGAGGHGQVVADIIRAQARAGLGCDFAGYLDDTPHPGDGLPTRGTVGEWRPLRHDALIVAIGDNKTRRGIFERLLREGARFAVACHPAATIAPDVAVGDGSMVCAGVVINTRARIGRNVIVNTSASVDHHCAIGDHAHVAPGVRLGGNVDIGEGALVGIGAIVLPGVRVGPWSVVGAGAVVNRDVGELTTVVGVPARVLVTT